MWYKLTFTLQRIYYIEKLGNKICIKGIYQVYCYEQELWWNFFPVGLRVPGCGCSSSKRKQRKDGSWNSIDRSCKCSIKKYIYTIYCVLLTKKVTYYFDITTSFCKYLCYIAYILLEKLLVDKKMAWVYSKSRLTIFEN